MSLTVYGSNFGIGTAPSSIQRFGVATVTVGGLNCPVSSRFDDKVRVST